MEKTISIFDIFRSALKEWFGGEKEAISNEKIESGEISDAEFAEVAKCLEPDIIAQLQRTRNGRGADKLDNNGDKKGFVKKVFVSENKESKKVIKNPNREIETEDFNREI